MGSDFFWSFGPAALAVAGATLAAIILWFLLRQQKRRALLPILEVLKLEVKAVPRLRFTEPPLWPFICFLIAAGALAVFSLEPSEAISKKDNLDLRYTHVIFDLSPSIEASKSKADYLALAQYVLNRLDNRTKISFSVSSSSAIFPLAKRDELNRLIGEQGYHRAGFKIGSAVEKLIAKAPDIEHLVIVSDADRASWDDFNWSYLEKKIQVSWYPVGAGGNPAGNVFIDDVKQPAVSDEQQNWVATIRRSAPGDAIHGKLVLEMDGKEISSQNWNFEGATQSLEVEMKGPPDTDGVQKVLVWKLTSDSKSDLIADNTFRSWLNARDKKAMLVSQPGGEMFLEDAFFHLKTSLDVLGFKTSRFDKLTPETSYTTQLVVAEAKPSQPRSFFCPAVNKADAYNRQIWLIPSEGMRDYGELCACAANFIEFPKPVEGLPRYCENLQTRDQYIGVLQSLGALQVGGDVGSPLGAIAMQFLNKASHIRLLAFSVPLTPSPESGISYGRLPLLLNAFFQLVPLDSKDYVFGRWPRIEDISSERETENVDLSNIPFLESSLQMIPDHRMPPKLSFSDRGMVRQNSFANREKDARPWIMICLWLVAGAFWLEVLGGVLARIFSSQQWVQRWFILLFVAGAGLLARPAQAQVQMNLYGYGKVPNLSNIRREVAGRTSIELLDNPKMNAQFNAVTLSEPWLWVAEPRLLESLSASERADLVGWLERGGFLIVENFKSGEFKAKIADAIPGGQWKPIPPDHELMRSFHLLASLPQCGEIGWEGFQFDQRLAILLIPGDFLDAVTSPKGTGCFGNISTEQAGKIFINLMMVVLTTDYKKDQVHLPEILKRLR